MDTTPSTPSSPDTPNNPDKPASIPLTSLTQLAEITRRPKEITFILSDTERFTFQVRALTGEESDEADKILSRFDLPPRQVRKLPGGATEDYYDYDDPKYKADKERATQLKGAFMICKGLVGVEIPGETLESRNEWMQKNLSPRLIAGILNEILKVTSSAIERANF